jgi:hypothetical protein
VLALLIIGAPNFPFNLTLALAEKSAIWHVKHLGAQGMGLRGMSQAGISG